MLLKEGVERWRPVLRQRGLTLEVSVMEVPSPAPTAVVTDRFKPVGARLDLDAEETMEVLVLGDENWGLGGMAHHDGDIRKGEAVVRSDLPTKTAGQQEFIRNLGAHEMSHVLGLADDEQGVVTNHLQQETEASFSQRDLDEVSMLYPVNPADPPRAIGTLREVREDVQPRSREATTLEVFRYQYSYIGPEVGHVALVTLEVDPRVLVEVECPAGWLCLTPVDLDRTSLDHAFYQDHMEDGHPVPRPYSPGVRLPIALRAQAPGSALTAENPNLEFSIVVRDHRAGVVSTWAGGDACHEVQGPVTEPTAPTVPAASTLGLVVLGAVLGLSAVLLLRRESLRVK
ncbi:MAG TPA: hypothetical protein VF017_11020 [Thermoanaerobaculia bacterium]|nr:hypothetical protein [Thermoanaerobaculia bacterium]